MSVPPAQALMFYTQGHVSHHAHLAPTQMEAQYAKIVIRPVLHALGQLLVTVPPVL